jgi:hypothetical protein
VPRVPNKRRKILAGWPEPVREHKGKPMETLTELLPALAFVSVIAAQPRPS